jgi:hypothetical protein
VTVLVIFGSQDSITELPIFFSVWRYLYVVKLTFYCGVDEIGSNKILLEDKKNPNTTTTHPKITSQQQLDK